MSGSGALACALGRRRVHDPKDWPQIRQQAARLWLERGLILINPKDVDNAFNRQALINEANKQYGQRSEEE